MQLIQAVELIKHPVGSDQSSWADLGCGDGLFTNALSQLLAENSIVYAVDKNQRALNKVSAKEGVQLKKIESDFIKDGLPFKNLTAILMANSFHYVKDKNGFIQKLINCLSEDGYFLIVEYDTDRSNPWVPYPLNFNSLRDLFNKHNYSARKLQQVSSRYNGMIYSAIVERLSLPGISSGDYGY